MDVDVVGVLVVVMVVVEVGKGRNNGRIVQPKCCVGKINMITWYRSFNGLREKQSL